VRTSQLFLVMLTFLWGAVSVQFADADDYIDLRQAVVVSAGDDRVIKTAERVLIEEVAKRTGITLVQSKMLSTGKKPTILLCQCDEVPDELQEFVKTMNVPKQAEGFAIAVHGETQAPVVVLLGRDQRGVLFSVGRLLLKMRMKTDQLELPSGYHVATAPRYPHRGHQIGYRNLSHCYDAWTEETYEQYMRELAVFGANAFETTSFSLDGRDGPHAKLTGGEMAKAWSRICADYGYQFWLFSGAVGGQGESE